MGYMSEKLLNHGLWKTKYFFTSPKCNSFFERLIDYIGHFLIKIKTSISKIHVIPSILSSLGEN